MHYEDFKRKPHNWGIPENEIWRRYQLFMEQEMFKQLHLQLLEAKGESSSSSSSASGGGSILEELPPSDPYERLLWQASRSGYQAPSSAQQEIQKDLIQDLIDADIWDSIDVLYVYAQDGSSGFSLLNWKNAVKNQGSPISSIASPVWTSNVGWYIGNGVLRHDYIMSRDSVNYKLNDAGFFFYTGNITGSTSTRWIGSVAAGSAPFRLRIPGNTHFNTLLGYTGVPAPLANSLYASYRLDSTNVRYYRGLTATDIVTSETTSLLGFPIEFGLGFFLVPAEIKVFGFSSNLDGKHSDLNAIIENYISQL